jgi:hypothetical protein
MMEGLVELDTDETFHLSVEQLRKIKKIKSNENTHITIVYIERQNSVGSNES